MARSHRLRSELLHAPVGRTLLRLAGPMVLGLAAIILFQVVDTFFVAMLGADELAALGFTFPVTFVVTSLTLGIGLGTTSVIAQAIGRGDRSAVRRLTTHGLALAVILVVLLASVGLLTIEPLFAALGADPATIERIDEYMTPWYLGVAMLVIPMIGNSAIRATGDTKTPSVVMMIAAAANAVFDPLLIFGVGPFPRLGLRGAAIATVVSWVITFVAALWILHRRERMLDLSAARLGHIWESWREILRIGLPAAGANILVPVSAGILTRMVASFGTTAVAAYGVGTRIESVALIGFMALASASAPLVAQNIGAANAGRVQEALSFCWRASFGWGFGCALLLFLFARPIATVFSDEPRIVEIIVSYETLVPVSYGFLGVAQIIHAMLNAMSEPGRAVLLTVLRLFVLIVPLAHLGARTAGLPGLFLGVALANVLIAGASYLTMRRRLLSLAQRG